MVISNTTEIDQSRLVYVPPDVILKDKIISTLIAFGFKKNQIVFAETATFANEGDYSAPLIRENQHYFLLISRLYNRQVTQGSDMPRPVNTTISRVIEKKEVL